MRLLPMYYHWFGFAQLERALLPFNMCEKKEKKQNGVMQRPAVPVSNKSLGQPHIPIT